MGNYEGNVRGVIKTVPGIALFWWTGRQGEGVHESIKKSYGQVEEKRV